jgi:hypothetical protein
VLWAVSIKKSRVNFPDFLKIFWRNVARVCGDSIFSYGPRKTFKFFFFFFSILFIQRILGVRKGNLSAAIKFSSPVTKRKMKTDVVDEMTRALTNTGTGKI